MENPVNYLIENICDFFVEPVAAAVAVIKKNDKSATSLVRIHNEKLKNIGDISFPCNADIWRNYYAHTRRRIREEAFAMCKASASEEDGSDETTNVVNAFLAAAQKWTYPVERIQLHNDRCALFLRRQTVLANLLHQVLANSNDDGFSYGHLRKNRQCRIHVQEQQLSAVEESDLSLYRAKLVANALRRVLRYSEWIEDNATKSVDDVDVLQLQVLSVAAKGIHHDTATSVQSPQRKVIIKCGIVTDPSTGGKLAKLHNKEYLNLRSNDLYSIAVHKYGIRVKDDARFVALMERMGAAAVAVDLLEVKHSSPVQIIRNRQGSTKGASFILYNSARLETLLRTFDERVQSSAYGRLPDINDVDLTLLNEEEEWQLVYGYILAFPNLIEHCLEKLELGQCAIHLIIRYLSGFVSIFSIYYRRIRILTDTRDHLMPYVYARIYLVKAVREILNKTLALLDIEPVLFM